MVTLILVIFLDLAAPAVAGRLSISCWLKADGTMFFCCKFSSHSLHLKPGSSPWKLKAQFHKALPAAQHKPSVNWLVKMGLQQPGKAMHTNVTLTEWTKLFLFHNRIKFSLRKLILLVSQEVWTWACVGLEIIQWLNSSIDTNSDREVWVGFCWVGLFLVWLVWGLLLVSLFFTCLLYCDYHSKGKASQRWLNFQVSLCVLQRSSNPKATQTDQQCKNGNPVQAPVRLILQRPLC